MENEDNNEKPKDPIGRALDIPDENSAVKEIIIEAHNDSAKNDFEIARANMLIMIQTATEAIEDLHGIAKQSQQARAFEVLSKLIDTTVNANKSLLDLQGKIKELKEIDKPINPSAIHNNQTNLFVGSTNELSKLIENLKTNKNDQK